MLSLISLRSSSSILRLFSGSPVDSCDALLACAAGRTGLVRVGGLNDGAARGTLVACGNVEGEDRKAVSCVVCCCVRSRILQRSCMSIRAQTRCAVF